MIVLKRGRKKSAVIQLEVSWDPKVDKFGPAPGMIMAVLETAPELKGLKVRRWGFIDMHEREVQ